MVNVVMQNKKKETALLLFVLIKQLCNVKRVTNKYIRTNKYYQTFKVGLEYILSGDNQH